MLFANGCSSLSRALYLCCYVARTLLAILSFCDRLLFIYLFVDLDDSIKTLLCSIQTLLCVPSVAMCILGMKQTVNSF